MKKSSLRGRAKAKAASALKAAEAGRDSGRDSGREPFARQTMFRPGRLKYVRRGTKPGKCVFCAAAKAGVGFSKLVLYKGERAMVVLNKFPYNNGHVLVVPVRHEGDFLKLGEKTVRDLHALLAETIRIVSEVYDCSGMNAGLNLGSAAGAGIPDHIHYHVVPRWRGDTNFFPLLADAKVVVETLEQTYARLLPPFEKLAKQSPGGEPGAKGSARKAAKT